MQTKTKKDVDFLFLDGIRALAALYILLHHSVLQYFDSDVHDLTGIKMLTIAAFFKGHFAVDFFIVLSGFCLMLSVIKANLYLKGGSLLFYKKRIIRILPPYYFAIILSLLLIWLFVGERTGTHWDISIPVSFRDVFTHAFLIHDFFRENTLKINHSLWSISVEFRIYILFPALVYAWRMVGPIYTFLISIVLAFLMYLILLLLRNYYYDISLHSAGVNPYIILFTLGMLAAYCSVAPADKSTIKHKINWLLLATFILTVAGSFLITRVTRNSNDTVTFFLSAAKDVSFGIFCFFFLIFCSRIKINKNFRNPASNLLSSEPLVFIGSFSYSLYLIHAPLIPLLSGYIVDPLHLSRYSSAFLLILLSLVIILPISYLFFLVFEKPFMNLNKSLNVKQAERAAVLNPAP